MFEIKDQLNNTLLFTTIPKRIISVVPSQTELLYDLGLDKEIVGITNFCIHPKEKFLSKTRVGGTKQLNLNKIVDLEPDLIIANKEENQQEQIEELQQRYPVWISDIETLEDAYSMIHSIGEIIDKKDISKLLVTRIQSEFDKLTPISNTISNSVAYFIWKTPWMVAAGNTFIDVILSKLGFENVFGKTETRYPEIDLSELIKHNPKYVFLSSEPYPFKEKNINEIKSILPDTIIKLVDGEMFSWYGSRLLLAPTYFEKLIQNLQQH